MITCAIEVHEEIDVAIIDIPCVYLPANTEEHVILLIQGMLVDLISMIYPKLYINFVIINSKGESMLYVKIQKSLYGL